MRDARAVTEREHDTMVAVGGGDAGGLAWTRPMTHAVARGGPDLLADAQALLDAAVAITSGLDLHSVLARIVVAARQITGARYGVVLGHGLSAGARATTQPGPLAPQRKTVGPALVAVRLGRMRQHLREAPMPMHAQGSPNGIPRVGPR